MLPANLEEGFRATSRGCCITAEYVVVDLEMPNNGERRGMSGVDGARE